MRIERKHKPVNWYIVLKKVIVAFAVGIAFGVAMLAVIFIAYKPLKEVIGNKDNGVVIQVKDEEGRTEGRRKGSVLVGDEIESVNLNRIGDGLQKALVRINLRFYDSYSSLDTNSNVPTGIIISQTTKYILILTTQSAINGTVKVKVTFYDGTTTEAQVLEKDSTVDVAMLKVPLANISDSLRESLVIAELGNSTYLTPGEDVVFVGNVMGVTGASEVASIVDLSSTISVLDGELSVIRTDKIGKSYSNGFVINSSGSVVGIITHTCDEEGEPNYLTAVAISDVSDTIEMLCNEQSFPYVGLILKTIPTETSVTYEEPNGIYIDTVEPGSPAEDAGLRAGDIITQVGEQSFISGRQFRTIIYEQDIAGEIPPDLIIKILRYGNGAFHRYTFKVSVGQR